MGMAVQGGEKAGGSVNALPRSTAALRQASAVCAQRARCRMPATRHQLCAMHPLDNLECVLAHLQPLGEDGSKTTRSRGDERCAAAPLRRRDREALTPTKHTHACALHSQPTETLTACACARRRQQPELMLWEPSGGAWHVGRPQVTEFGGGLRGTAEGSAPMQWSACCICSLWPMCHRFGGGYVWALCQWCHVSAPHWSVGFVEQWSSVSKRLQGRAGAQARRLESRT